MYTIAEIAHSIGADFVGNGGIVIQGLEEPANCTADHIAVAMKPEFAETIRDGSARAALMWQDAEWQSYGLEAAILVSRPRYVLSDLTPKFDRGQGYNTGIHPNAVIDPSAELAEDVSVGPFTVIGKGVKIGTGSVIGPQVFIGNNVQIGAGALIHAGARILSDVEIGTGFILHPNAVIGGDGFSFVTPEASNAEQTRASLGAEDITNTQQWARIHSLGSVLIGNNVEIGCSSCIDRGTIRHTQIGNGTKIDNQVQIGHNCVVGDDVIMCGQSGLAGSVKVGNSAVIAGKVAVSDNLIIGERAVLGGGSGVTSNVPAGRAMLGYPAIKMETQVDIYKATRRLPRLLREFTELKKAVSKLTSSD